MSKNPTVSVIIPVLNGSEHIRTCLEAISASDYHDFECIVINDGSEDDTLSIIEEYKGQEAKGSRGREVEILNLTHTHGQAYARNRGAEVARGQTLLFVDADVVIRPDTISRVMDTFKGMPAVDAVFGSYDDEPGAPNFLSQYKNLFHHYVHQRSRQEASTFWCGCGAIKRDTFLKIGGFNVSEKLRAIEDIELGYRLRAKHYNICINKNIQVKHLKRYSFIGLLSSDIFHRAIPWSSLMLSSGNVVNDLNTKTGYKVSLGIVALLAVSIPFAATWWGLGLTALLTTVFSVLHKDFYRFFINKRGVLFALQVFPLHLLYYLYSGFSFAFSALNFLLKKKKLKEDYERDTFSKFVFIK